MAPNCRIGSYMGVAMSEVTYQAPKNDHFAYEAKPSKGKTDWP